MQSALQCPADLPYGAAARDAFLAAGSQPAPVVMNCSGKHAAMLWTCVMNGWAPEEYLRPEHPLQRYLRDTITSLAGAPAEPASTDGCGAPLYGLPLVGLARAVQVLPSTPAGGRVCAAMRAYPEFVGGTDRDVTHLMRGVPGLVAKDGAEAVQAMVIDVDGRRFGIGLKIEDGAQRARSVVAAVVLGALGVVTPVTLEHRRQPVLGGGRPVGWIRPSAALDGLRVAEG
jgi:L-asparaginase II